ncbi:MAG: Dynein light chain 1, axonemal [Paramarteilia canceri]
MSKATTIKEAIQRWEEKSGNKAGQSEEVLLYFQNPLIEKMDASLSMVSHVKKLSLSSNNIEKIANLNGFSNLKILSLGRNNIKSLAGLESVGESLEELWISYNLIEKLKGIGALKKLKVLFMSNNLVKDWAEFSRLSEVATLEELVFVGNPLEEKVSQETGDYKDQVEKKLVNLKKLDGVPIVRANECDNPEETHEES